MAYVGKIGGKYHERKQDMLTEICHCYNPFLLFKWFLAKSLNFRILFQIVSNNYHCHPMI